MTGYIIGLIILLISIYASRAINNNATQKLNDQKKVLIVDLFSKGSSTAFVILIGLIVLFFLSLKFHWLNPTATYVYYFTAIISYLGVTSYISFKKLKENDFPNGFIQAYLMSSVVRIVGMTLFFLLLKFK